MLATVAVILIVARESGFCESFSGRMRDELLNESLFLGLDHAREKITNWTDDHNRWRPHSALGLSDAGGQRRQPFRNVRSAAQPRPTPPIACCSPRALRLKSPETLIIAG